MRVDRPFSIEDLHALRAEVSAYASGLGASREQIDALLIVAVELATNALRHGGGGGQFQLWQRGDAMLCRVIDHGPGMADPTAGLTPPDPLAADGRGLWICRQFAQDLDVRTAPTGTTVTARIDLGAGQSGTPGQ
jgi:anti-sigma regulatory factor (Ser/Thr protein kinase)